MERPVLDVENVKKISILELGAVGDGKTDDLDAFVKAIKYASENSITLVLPEAEYYLSARIRMRDLTVLSENATLLYYGTEHNAPCISMYDNVYIFGQLNIYANDDGGRHHGERCCMAFGHYGTGEGAHHCYVESVHCTGGVHDANGVLVTGDSSDILIDRVTVPRCTKIKRGFLAHWGNANDHQATSNFDLSLGSKGYYHVDGWKPVVHPHDIHVGLVECEGLMPLSGVPRNKDSDNGAASICACYDITIDEIRATDCCHAFFVTGADLGFEYSSPEEREHGQRGIHIGKVHATGLTSAGMYITGFAWFNQEEGVKTEIKVDEAYLEAAEGDDHWHGQPAVSTVKIKSGEFGNITYKGYDVATASSNCGKIIFKSISKEGD